MRSRRLVVLLLMLALALSLAACAGKNEPEEGSEPEDVPESGQGVGEAADVSALSDEMTYAIEDAQIREMSGGGDPYEVSFTLRLSYSVQPYEISWFPTVALDEGFAECLTVETDTPPEGNTQVGEAGQMGPNVFAYKAGLDRIPDVLYVRTLPVTVEEELGAEEQIRVEDVSGLHVDVKKESGRFVLTCYEDTFSVIPAGLDIIAGGETYSAGINNRRYSEGELTGAEFGVVGFPYDELPEDAVIVITSVVRTLEPAVMTLDFTGGAGEGTPVSGPETAEPDPEAVEKVSRIFASTTGIYDYLGTIDIYGGSFMLLSVPLDFSDDALAKVVELDFSDFSPAAEVPEDQENMAKPAKFVIETGQGLYLVEMSLNVEDFVCWVVVTDGEGSELIVTGPNNGINEVGLFAFSAKTDSEDKPGNVAVISDGDDATRKVILHSYGDYVKTVISLTMEYTQPVDAPEDADFRKRVEYIGTEEYYDIDPDRMLLRTSGGDVYQISEGTEPEDSDTLLYMVKESFRMFLGG